VAMQASSAANGRMLHQGTSTCELLGRRPRTTRRGKAADRSTGATPNARVLFARRRAPRTRALRLDEAPSHCK
jgi:hypothetical protein